MKIQKSYTDLMRERLEQEEYGYTESLLLEGRRDR